MEDGGGEVEKGMKRGWTRDVAGRTKFPRFVSTKIDLLFESYQNRILNIFKINMTGSIASNWIFMSIRERNPILHLRVVGVFLHMAVII